MDTLSITLSVGPGQPNQPADVSIVQNLLNRHSFLTRRTLNPNGQCDGDTQSAIRAFQKNALGIRFPDGIVGAHGITLERLAMSNIRAHLTKHVHSASPAKRPSTLTEQDYILAAAELNCEVSAIKAVASVETGTQGAFDASGRPTLLFERHYFSRLTKRRYDKTHPDISNRHAGGYGQFAAQYGKLERASLLDLEAAQRSASWGAFQIMGDHYKEAGFSSIEDFVAAMKRSEADQLRAFTKFIQSDSHLLRAIRKKDWPALARGYNGKGYKKNAYDTKLKQAYELAHRKQPEVKAVEPPALNPAWQRMP